MNDIGHRPFRPAKRRSTRIALRVLAVLSLVLAVAGAILPGLPCTEFVLLAAWAAARSSPRLHDWLWQHRVFGTALRNWHDGRRVSRASKIAATVSMSACAVLLAFTVPHAWLRWGATGCMAVVLAWLWSRPLPRPVPTHPPA